MTNLLTINNINNEVNKTLTNINEKSILYNILQENYNINNDILMSFDTKISLIESKINAINTSLNYNFNGNDNYMCLLSILKKTNIEYDNLKKIKIEYNNKLNEYDNSLYNTNLEIQLLNEYLEHLNKMKNRMNRWNNITNLTDEEKYKETYKNNYLFEEQLNSILNK